jgi:nucleotide-binding universal stress UspA family protein
MRPGANALSDVTRRARKPEGGSTMKRILLAYDGTTDADAALTTTITLAKAFDAEVGVVSVIPVHPGRTPVDPWDDRPAHAVYLQRARQLLTDAGIEPLLIEPAGDPAIVIEEEAERGGYDTIVIGSRRLGAVGRLLQGSVSEHVATHAKTTVVVAH